MSKSKEPTIKERENEVIDRVVANLKDFIKDLEKFKKGEKVCLVKDKPISLERYFDVEMKWLMKNYFVIDRLDIEANQKLMNAIFGEKKVEA